MEKRWSARCLSVREDTPLMSVSELMSALDDRRLSVVAKATGLSYHVLWRFRNVRFRGAPYEVIAVLSLYFSKGNRT